MITNQQITVLASATRSAGTASIILNTRHTDRLDLHMDVTGMAGTTPTLDLLVKYTDPASGTPITLASFIQATGVTAESVAITAGMPEEVTVEWTIGGTATPTATFSLGGVRRMS